MTDAEEEIYERGSQFAWPQMLRHRLHMLDATHHT